MKFLQPHSTQRKFQRRAPTSSFPFLIPNRNFDMKVYARKLNKELPAPKGTRPPTFHTITALLFAGLILFIVTSKSKFLSALTQNTKLLNTLHSTTPKRLDIPTVKGGHIYQVLPTWNRLHVPWFRPPSVKLLTPSQSRHRYLYSSTRLATSDGIGHSMGVINYHFNLALRLNLTYTHRIGLYSSLTAGDIQAVERFFAWGVGEIPRTKIQQHACLPHNDHWPNQSDIYQCHTCKQPNPHGPLNIKHLVDIPPLLISGCRSGDLICDRKVAAFLSENDASHTIFQTPKQHCSPPATDANFLSTKGLFYHKYWNAHGIRPWHTVPSQGVALRPIRLMPSELNIAVHIRRGDFLDPTTRQKREITTDAIFAKVIVDALAIVDAVGGIFAEMPVTLHVYSEGKVKGDTLSIHDVQTQDRKYYDSTGKPREADWFRELILNTSPHSKLVAPRHLDRRLRIVMHISEDTLLSLHEMVSSDIFVGSNSGLSNALVWSLSRGIVLIPHAGTIDSEIGRKGYRCCSVAYDNDSGSFIRALFKRYWKAYVKANKDSALQSTRALLESP